MKDMVPGRKGEKRWENRRGGRIWGYLSEKERFCRERRGFAGKGEVLQINLRIFAKLMEEALNRGPLRSKDL